MSEPEHGWITGVRRQWAKGGLYGTAADWQPPVVEVWLGPTIDPELEREARRVFRRQLSLAFNDIAAELGLGVRVPGGGDVTARGMAAALRHP